VGKRPSDDTFGGYSLTFLLLLGLEQTGQCFPRQNMV
jgi:hypothetical protein